jgi:tRNA-2-methylthio-N6-dimethylallyladenosine synthase
MGDNVPKKEKERRWKILTEILKKTALEKNKKFIGKEVEVLIDCSNTNFCLGKTRYYKTVKIQLDPKPYTLNANLIGQFVKVKIENALPWGLKGKII